MKKLIAIFLVVVMGLSFSACSSGNDTAAIDDALQGEWYFIWSIKGTSGQPVSALMNFVFDHGNCTITRNVSGISLGTEEGTYEIKDDVISVTTPSDSDDTDENLPYDIPYTFSRGVLTMFNNTGECQLVRDD